MGPWENAVPMPRWNAALFALALCGLTAACSDSAPTGNSGAYEQRLQAWLAANPPGTPATDFPLVDGTYKGQAQLVSQEGASCPVAKPGTVDIGDRWLIHPYQPNMLFIARIQPDGSFAAWPVPGGTLEGYARAGWLEFTVRTPTCESHYKLRWTM
jgi:hypothetical protein